MDPVTQVVSDYLDDSTTGMPVQIVTIAFADGFSQRLTTHDQSLVWAGATYFAGGTGKLPAISYGGHKRAAGTEVTTCKLSLLCGGDSQINGKRVTLMALDGDFRGAWVTVDHAYLSAPDTVLGVKYAFSGPLAEAAPSSTRVEITVESGMALLNLRYPRRTYQASCSHELFDAGCGLVKADWTDTGTVGSSATATVIPSGLLKAEGYYVLGVLTFTSGALAGEERQVVAYTAAGTFTVDRPLPVAPAAGVTFSVFPGCPKSKVACEGTFSNMARFNGLPFVPKNESGRIG